MTGDSSVTTCPRSRSRGDPGARSRVGPGAGGRTRSSLTFPSALFFLSPGYRNSSAEAGSLPAVFLLLLFFGAGKGKEEETGAVRNTPGEISGASAPLQQSSAVALRPLPERSEQLLQAPPAAGVSPPPALICMALPLPRCHWSAPGSAPPTAAGFRPPSRPELRAAGGLLNRGGGGGGRGGSGSRSGDESAAPRVGGRRAGS